MYANNSDKVGKAVSITQATWPLPPDPKVVEVTNMSITIYVALGEFYKPLVNLSLIVSSYSS